MAGDPRVLLIRNADRHDGDAEGDQVRLEHPVLRRPVYTYSLKQGIQDGFLAPYKVINVHIDVDVEGYRPDEGQDRPRGRGDSRTASITRRTSTGRSSSTTARSWSPSGSPSSSRRAATGFRRRSCSVSTRSTQRGCGRRSSTRTQISSATTAGTSCGSPATTARAGPARQLH